MDSFAKLERSGARHNSQSRPRTFNMERRDLSREDWEEIEQRFSNIAQTSTRISNSRNTGGAAATADSDCEVEDLQAILDDALRGMDRLDPQRANAAAEQAGRLAESSGSDSRAGPSAHTTSGLPPAAQQQAIDSRANTGQNQRNPSAQAQHQQTCESCGTNTTPEWRRGPTGPRTLCNACGLYYAKLQRRRARGEEDPEDDESNSGGGSVGDGSSNAGGGDGITITA